MSFYRLSKTKKREYAIKLEEVKDYCDKNHIYYNYKAKSFYFSVNGKDYRVSNHTVEASNKAAFDEFGYQWRELYHPKGRKDEIQIFASPVRLIEIHQNLLKGLDLDGRGRVKCPH